MPSLPKVKAKNNKKEHYLSIPQVVFTFGTTTKIGNSFLHLRTMHQEEEQKIEAFQDTVFEEQTFIIDKGEELKRIDKWLQARIERATRNKIQKSIEQGFLTVNGKTVKSNYKIRPGDKLVLLSETHPEYNEIIPENLNLSIVYEDNDIMVVHKPKNMVVHPGIGNHKGTLLNGIAYHLQQQNIAIDEASLPRMGLVHRIDKNTTGLLVIAKNPQAAVHLAKQFSAHTVQRKYVALVWGNIEADEGTINAHVGRHPRFRKMFTTFQDGSEGKHAITHYKVLKRMNYVTLVECRLETGRTHQIRVHMRSIGHTLFNDWEYGGNRILKGTIYSKYKQFVDNCFEVCPRCALHAKTLGFIHPSTGENMFFDSPLPEDMHNVIEKWEKYVEVKGTSLLNE